MHRIALWCLCDLKALHTYWKRTELLAEPGLKGTSSCYHDNHFIIRWVSHIHTNQSLPSRRPAPLVPQADPLVHPAL